MLEAWGPSPLDPLVTALPTAVLLLSIGLFRFGSLRSTPQLVDTLTNSMVDLIMVFDRTVALLGANAPALHLLKVELVNPRREARFDSKPISALLRDGSEMGSFIRSDFVGVKRLDLSDDREERSYVAQRVALDEVAHGISGSIVGLQYSTGQLLRFDDLQHYTHRIAHDLRNPLTSIVSLAEVLSIQARDAEAQQITKDLLSSSEQLRELIRHAPGRRVGSCAMG